MSRRQAERVAEGQEGQGVEPEILGPAFHEMASKLGVECCHAGRGDDLPVGSTFSPTPDNEGDPTVTFIKCAGTPVYWMRYS